MNETKTNNIQGEKNSPSPSFMEIHRRVREEKLIEYRQDLAEIQDKLFNFKTNIMKKLRGVLYGK